MKASDKIVIGAGAAVCTACCAAPIAAFLTAVGLGAVLGVVLFGVVGLVVASLARPGDRPATAALGAYSDS